MELLHITIIPNMVGEKPSACNIKFLFPNYVLQILASLMFEDVCSLTALYFDCQDPVPGTFLGIISQGCRDSKSSQLHVDIFRFCCFHSVEVYCVDSSKMIGKFPT